MMTTQTLNLSLPLDEHIKPIWHLVRDRYDGLDEVSIIKLAINVLANQIRQEEYPMVDEATEARIGQALSEEGIVVRTPEELRRVLDEALNS